MVEQANAYTARVEPEYDTLTRALSDQWRMPKLVLRHASVLAVTGAVAALGTAAAGPIGGLVGGSIGIALAKGVTAVAERVGKGVIASSESPLTPTEMTYLFHVGKALRG